MMTPSFPMMDSLSRTADVPTLGNAAQHRIARHGARPLVFAGSQLAMAMSFTPGLPYWYEINIYRTSEQRFVLVIKLFHVAEDRKDTVDAWVFDTLPEVFDALEAHDAGRDVIADVDAVHAGLPPGELAVRAWELRARIEAARQHFAGLVGELLAEIDAVADAA
jgi:hypothetical protein